ncbi:hypothetical protein [Streptomyces sp. NBC_01013]|uniref:hypothetical protein n=1 Tax=Streptomyces sp. NBC_01013 TaxID=2903718 RepID=UPI00386A72E5|nr:hypothetical protein OG538_15815 [Streptomyces sp. NBC_01013]
MDSRELWERHAVLADAFCGADDSVREAQSVFDGCQAERVRMLAAFAVTVGSDGAVAELLGLGEREVRLARRTVGKDVARSLAEALLTPQPVGTPDPAGEQHVRSGEGDSCFTPAAEAARAAVERPVHPPAPVPSPRAEGASLKPTAPAGGPEWSPALDALLAEGWNGGIDAATLATRLGVELPQLVSRAQRLFADGRLTPVRRDGGRHRRSERGQVPGPQATPPNARFLNAPSAEAWPSSFDGAGPFGQHVTWNQAVYGHDVNGWAADSTESLPRHDWDGILHDWNRTHSAGADSV